MKLELFFRKLMTEDALFFLLKIIIDPYFRKLKYTFCLKNSKNRIF
ncbi:hypothetical protein LEP1GSC082_2172 [Leptospira kirschneri str. H2]|nr:hypothetical protein LEP1GSC082_2172 [Leptospira kirschneri str. H2]EMN26219.1 hypothetical protein LEP1GSC065_2940 [Leptospira kirschneri serovar Sokoine str. RM1]